MQRSRFSKKGQAGFTLTGCFVPGSVHPCRLGSPVSRRSSIIWFRSITFKLPQTSDQLPHLPGRSGKFPPGGKLLRVQFLLLQRTYLTHQAISPENRNPYIGNQITCIYDSDRKIRSFAFGRRTEHIHQGLCPERKSESEKDLQLFLRICHGHLRLLRQQRRRRHRDPE